METYKARMPDVDGFFGTFGGRFVAETLMPLLLELDAKWQEAKADSSFWARFELLCADSDEAAPLFRDDCAPGFRDDLAPCFKGSAGSDCCQFVRVMCQALRGRFRRRLSPLSSMRWALWTRRSRMASA
jgi:hypothetical protein